MVKIVNKRLDGVQVMVSPGANSRSRGGRIRLGRLPLIKGADWEPLVLTSVSPCCRGRLGGGVEQNWPRTPYFPPSFWLLIAFKMAHYFDISETWRLLWSGDEKTQHFDGFVLKAGCFDMDPHGAGDSWVPPLWQIDISNLRGSCHTQSSRWRKPQSHALNETLFVCR